MEEECCWGCPQKLEWLDIYQVYMSQWLSKGNFQQSSWYFTFIGFFAENSWKIVQYCHRRRRDQPRQLGKPSPEAFNCGSKWFLPEHDQGSFSNCAENTDRALQMGLISFGDELWKGETGWRLVLSIVCHQWHQGLLETVQRNEFQSWIDFRHRRKGQQVD